MLDSFHSQLARAEETFISAISQGSAAVESFYHSWSRLQATFSDAIQQERVDTETMELAQQVVPRIEIIANQFLELHEEADSIALSLHNELDVIFADLDLGTSSRRSEHNVRSLSDDVAASLPPYIGLAYTWLLNHLDNPYPSKETKSSIARETGSSLKDIENWFIKVRKRIGWNALRMKHYKNKRSKIVDAATRFFKECPQTLRYSPDATHLSGFDAAASHDSEFRAIESRAKELYPDKLFETALATKAGAVKDLIPEMKAHAVAEERRRRQVVKAGKSKGRQRLSAYPSPEPSPEQSPEISSVSLPIPDATLALSRKRRNCDRDFPELDTEDRRDEPQKRSRLDSYQISHDLAVASLPSPAASLSDIPYESSFSLSDQEPSENECIIFSTPPISAVPSGKRKRRLSDAGNDSPAKRPHNALVVPRLQTVSDPLPLSSPIINEWYKTMFGQAISDSIPGPVSVESLDDTQVEVDLYNYDASPDAIQPFLLANSSGPDLAASTANSELPSLEKSQASDSSFDFLFENYLKDLDVPQASTDIALFSDIPSHNHSTLFPFENMLPTTQPPQEDVLCDLYFQIPSPSWDIQGNGDSFSTITPSAGAPFSCSPVPPQINPTQNEKEAKRKQIEALRAQLQNLEAEL